MSGQKHEHSEESTDMTEQPRTDDRPPTEDRQADAPTDPTEPDAPSAESALSEAEAEREAFRNMALRYRADLENYKKRAAQELADARERANERLLLKAVDVADDFGRALDHLPPDADDGWLEGVRIAMSGMENMLASEGVSRIEADVGGEFDAAVHEALFMQPTDEVPEGSVAGVIRNGYKLRDRVLRAAQVSVASPAPKQEPTTNPAETENDPAAAQQETN